MRVVCAQDVKNMLLKQARMVYWKRWAAKHECEKSKDGVWLVPIQAMLRRKANEPWGRGRGVQKRPYNSGWSVEKKYRGCNKEEGTAKLGGK